MKKLSALILFLLSINCYSDTIVLSEKEDLFSSAYCLPVQVPDTVKSRKLVAVDSFDVNIVPPSSGVQLLSLIHISEPTRPY